MHMDTESKANKLILSNPRPIEIVDPLDCMKAVQEFACALQYIKEQTPEIPATNYNQALFQISQRIVLYSRPEYDLTAAVTQQLNAQYALQEKTEAATDTKQTAGQPTEKR